MRALFIAVLAAACAPSAEPATPVAATALAQIEASHDLAGLIVGRTDAPATIVFVFASWCVHCRSELHELDALRSHRVRMLGINYQGHEEYDHRGGSEQIRALAQTVPWLRVVPVGEDVFEALGSPPVIPTLYVYDHAGSLVATFDPRRRDPPHADELADLLAHLGA